MDTAGNISDGATSKFDGLLLRWRWYTYKLTHSTQPIYLVAIIEAGIIRKCLDTHAPVIKIEQPVKCNTVSFNPSLCCSTVRGDEELPYQPLHLTTPSPLILPHPPASEQSHY